MPALRLVLDWDGTVTVTDTLVQVLEEFGDWEVFQRAAAALERGEITLNEEIRRNFETVSAPVEEVAAWLVEHATVRPGFRELAERHSPLILSSGFHELIEPILAREAVELEVRANRIEARADGWRVVFRDRTACEVCGEPCKRASLPEGTIVYVGDGYSDRCAALAADQLYARDGLARYLDRQGVSYEPFDDLRDVSFDSQEPAPLTGA